MAEGTEFPVPSDVDVVMSFNPRLNMRLFVGTEVTCSLTGILASFVSIYVLKDDPLFARILVFLAFWIWGFTIHMILMMYRVINYLIKFTNEVVPTINRLNINLGKLGDVIK
jgi:hypothetical protein